MLKNTYIIIGIGAALVAGIIGLTLYMKKKKVIAPKVENFHRGHKFLVYNYLPESSIVLDVEEPVPENDTTKPIRLINELKPKSSVGIPTEKVIKYLKGGNLIRIFIILPTGERKLFTDYLIDTNDGDYIKSLHIGMITTRYIGSTDSLRMSTTSGNAVSGNAFLRIHNSTYTPLRLNIGIGDDEGIVVGPHSTDRYLGYLHQGVTLGTIFKDADGIYPDYQYLKPYTDLYYGVVSDLKQPLDGCWQLEYNDDCEYGQSIWPFQEGIL